MRRFFLLSACPPLASFAQTAAPAAIPAAAVESDELRFGSLSLYIENDKFAGTDRNYTNGIKLSVLSANLRAFDIDTVPGPLRALSRALRPLMSDHAIPKLGLSLGHQIYTPTDTETTLYQPADRPYAAWLYAGFTFQSYYPSASGETHARLSTVEVQLGAAGGDWALGEFVQNNYHKLINVETAKGWDNQLDSEPGLNLVYEHKWRLSSSGARTCLSADLIPPRRLQRRQHFQLRQRGRFRPPRLRSPRRLRHQPHPPFRRLQRLPPRPLRHLALWPGGRPRRRSRPHPRR